MTPCIASKRSSTRCRAKARTPAAPRCSAASPAAISGRAASRIATRPNACSATPTSSAPTAPAAAALPPPTDLASACRAAAGPAGASLIVLTGGEPMLQVDDALIDALHGQGFEIAIETNGTLPVPPAIDWICVSPKAGTELKQRTGHELKLVYPQPELPPEAVDGPRLRPPLPAAHGRPRARPQHHPCRRLLQGAPALAPLAAIAQADRHPLRHNLELAPTSGFPT